MHVKLGPCLDKVTIRTFHHNGITFSEHGEGASAGETPFVMAEAGVQDHATIHGFFKGHCYSAEGKADHIKDLEVATEKRGYKMTAGDCHGATKCHEWRDFHICKSISTEEAWGGDKVHVEVKGHCIQF